MHFVRRRAPTGEKITDPLADRLTEIGGGLHRRRQGRRRGSS
jgi:hypothetical protein